MAELENCMRIFARIDQESGKGENTLVREFEKISGLSLATTPVSKLVKKRTHIHDSR